MKLRSRNQVEDRLRNDLLASLHEDYLDLASVVHEVARAFGELAEDKLRLYSLTVIYHLLDEGMVRAGLVNTEGAFMEWSQSPQFATERMLEAWERSGRLPIMGEIAWFDLTPSGKAYAEVLFS